MSSSNFNEKYCAVFPNLTDVLRCHTQETQRAVLQALLADLQGNTDDSRSAETAHDAYYRKAEDIAATWGRPPESDQHLTEAGVPADEQIGVSNDEEQFKAEALKQVLEALGKTDDPAFIDFVKVALEHLPNHNLPKTTKKRLLGACKSTIERATQLRTAIARLQQLSLPVIPPDNGNMYIAMSERLRQLDDGVDEIASIAEQARETFERNIKGRYATTTSQQQRWLWWLVWFWRDTGHKVTTTQDGEFANYLSSAYEAAYGRTRQSLSDLLADAKIIAQKQEPQSVDELAAIMLHAQLEQTYIKQARHRVQGKKPSKYQLHQDY